MDGNEAHLVVINESNKFKVIVIGAGLGGCAAALAFKHHHPSAQIIVFEKVRQFQRLGDSLGLGENALKLLRKWTLRQPEAGQPESMVEELIDIGNKSEFMQIRRWGDGKVLARQPLMDMAGYIGHRGDYHQVFLKAVERAGIPIKMGSEVGDYLLIGSPGDAKEIQNRGSVADPLKTGDRIQRKKAVPDSCKWRGI